MQTQVSPVAQGTRRLALCFDGTWNSYKSHTNVSRFFEAIADQTRTALRLKFYDEGFGTTWGTVLARRRDIPVRELVQEGMIGSAPQRWVR